MSQRFPDYGIVAGAPVYDGQAVGLSGLWADKAIQAITPAPIQKLPSGNRFSIRRFRSDQIHATIVWRPRATTSCTPPAATTHDSAYWS
jgi:hypothetical protein